TLHWSPIANQHFYGRGAGVGRGLGVGSALGVGVGLGVALGVAVAVAVGVGVGVDEPDWSQYLPPVFQRLISSVPPQTIISLPVQTAVCPCRPVGAPVVLVAIQLSMPGLYLPPVLVLG